MRVRIDEKDFINYPFLKESQNFVSGYAGSPERFLATSTGKAALSQAKDRILSSIAGKSGRKAADRAAIPTDSEGIKVIVSGYALARVIISCMKDRMIIDRFSRSEAQNAYECLIDEEPEKKVFVATSLGIDIDADEVPLVSYVELSAGMREERWRLVNRDIEHGMVKVKKNETDEILRESIRVTIGRNLPLPIPQGICEVLAPVVKEISEAEQQHLLEQFGSVEESSFPPCMQALILALSAGTNISHPGRFALTAFLHNIGMNSSDIIGLYCRAPDFDLSRTMYQVQHISGRGGTEYTAPSCAAMRTTAVCVKKDQLCERVSHPLSYYKQKKRNDKKKITAPSGNMLVDRNAGGAHREKEAGNSENIRDSRGHQQGEHNQENNKKNQA
ncbi:MAG: DNA primase large subunit PriL [Methanomicrobiales archaeon]